MIVVPFTQIFCQVNSAKNRSNFVVGKIPGQQHPLSQQVLPSIRQAGRAGTPIAILGWISNIMTTDNAPPGSAPRARKGSLTPCER
jgi:hypothetical protein